MAKVGTGRVVRLIETLWEVGTAAALDDAELLGRFLRRDGHAEAAFAALVERHAPMVLRVCRDVTGDPHDAQDAAQVTFLILAQKARFIRRGDALANWLFGTARRVAARALRDAVRHRQHEQRYAQTIERRRELLAQPEDPEWDWAGLYQELDRLPERYRVPIVLCDLEGLTHEQAAAALECPPRTVETRVYRGRERLRRRLVRRGLTPAVAFASGAITARAAPTTLPVAWATSTIHAAMQLATGGAAASLASPSVNSLVHGVNQAMFLSRLKWTGALAVFLGLSAGLTFAIAALTPGAGIQTTTTKTEVGARTSQRAESAEPAQPAPMTTPITVRGRAIAVDGTPVAGASIFLVSTNGTDAPLGTAITDGDGSYIFREARLPVRRWQEDAPLQGTFQVYGTATGHGFAWHGMRSYEPRRRPDDWKVSGEDYNIFGGQPIVMDLRFPPTATLGGRIVDEAGRPVPGVKIRIAHCDYLDTAGKETHHNFREFWAIHGAPESLRTTHTGPDGRFRLAGLPKEAGFALDLEHSDYAGLVLYAATTARPSAAFDYPGQSIIPGRARPPVATGELKVTLHSTRRIGVRTVFADTGKPAPKVRVSASRGSSGSAANGTTDADGMLVFRLPPGEYDVLADPTAGGAEVVRTLSTFKVTDQPSEQSLEVRVKPGCILILEVVDADFGKGVPGVEFRYEQDGQPGSRAPVQSRSGFIDNPRSDAQGRLRAVVEPGERIYAVGRIPESTGYRQQNPEARVTLPAGKTVTVRFKLERPTQIHTRFPLRVARLKHEGDWNVAPRAIPNLMDAVRKPPYRFDVAPTQKDLLARDPNLVYYPLICIHGRASISVTKDDLDGLHRYLDPGGGTLFADAACGDPAFDAAFRRFALRLYPNSPLVPIPANDKFFSALPGLDLTKCQYTRAAGGGKGRPQLEGVKVNGYWGIIYSKFGIGCALDREHDGGCKGYVRDDAVKIGANVVTYSSTP